MYVRNFCPGDELALHAVFHSAIHRLAAKDYTIAQLEAWAPLQPIDLENWVARIRSIRPFVAEDESGIVGYADLQEDGYIGVSRYYEKSKARNSADLGLMVL